MRQGYNQARDISINTIGRFETVSSVTLLDQTLYRFLLLRLAVYKGKKYIDLDIALRSAVKQFQEIFIRAQREAINSAQYASEELLRSLDIEEIVQSGADFYVKFRVMAGKTTSTLSVGV
jgi:hypothetical protein